MVEKLSAILEKHGWFYLGDTDASVICDEELESYRDWEIYAPLRNGGRLSVEILHRPSGAWWFKFVEFESEEEAVATAKRTINEVEAALHVCQGQLSLF